MQVGFHCIQLRLEPVASCLIHKMSGNSKNSMQKSDSDIDQYSCSKKGDSSKVEVSFDKVDGLKETNFNEDVDNKDNENVSSRNNEMSCVNSVNASKRVRKSKIMDGLIKSPKKLIITEIRSHGNSSQFSSDDTGVDNVIQSNVTCSQDLLNSVNDSSSVPVMKKRGRKKKSSMLSGTNACEYNGEEGNFSFCDTSVTSVTNSNYETKTNKKIKSEPTDDGVLHMSCDEADVNFELSRKIPALNAKRGRGRPRKVPLITCGHQNSGETEVINQKNCLKTSKDEEKSVSSSSSSGYQRGVHKRGRGRPRKSDINSSIPVITNTISLSERNSSFPVKGSNQSGRNFIHSGSKRRIVKPKRYDSYESFDFMDVNDRSKYSPINTSSGGQDEDADGDGDDDDSDALHVVEEEVEAGIVVEEDVNAQDRDTSGDGSNDKAKQKKPRVVTKRKKLIFRPTVTCGVCHVEMPEKEYENKHIDKHNFLCWREGEKPLDPNIEADIIQVYIKVRKIRKKNFNGMKCQKCGIRKKSAVGYFSHVQHCGMSQEEKEAMKIPCTICGRVMLPCSLKVHMGQEHRNPGSKEPPKIVEEEVIPLTKRKAARKAESKLEEVLAEEQKDENKPTKKVLALKRLYRQTQSKLFPSAYVKWRKELKESNEAKCFVEGCAFAATDLKSVQRHFFECPFAIRVFICKVCGVKLKTEFDIHKHITNQHKDCLTGDSDFQCRGSSDVEDDLEEFIFENDGHFSGGPRITADKPGFVIQAMRKKGVTFFTEVIDRSYKRYLEISSSVPLFEEFITPVDDVLSEEEAEKYLPVVTESMNFSPQCSNWKKLRRFEACNYNGTKLMFVGGPVWALSWCPMPLEETRQFLAVACHPEMNMIHAQGSTHAYNSLIQIWDCGKLDNVEGMDTEFVPKFKLGYAHSNGAVWSLEWCPTGCYQPSSGRLGLLAVGFSNGKASVYSVPSKTITTDRLPILNSNPILDLDLVREEPAQCTRIAWSKMPRFNIVACGYSDGLIAVFDLSSRSPLLRFGRKLNPYLMVQAHSRSITGLLFLPKEGNNYILSASSDRDIKFWNLQDTSGPVSVSQLYRMITVTDIAWFNNWPFGASVYDDALGYGLINVSLNGYRDFMFGQPYPVMSQNCVNWSISANDWTNAIATSSDGGELTVMYSKQLFHIDEKSNKRSKKYLTTTDLHKLDGNENIDPSIKLNVPQTYEEASECYGLVLKTENCNEFQSSRREDISRNFHQIKSINKVTWNLNGRSFLYLSAGYHAGFVQIFRDNTMDKYQIVFDHFYKKFYSENL